MAGSGEKEVDSDHSDFGLLKHFLTSLDTDFHIMLKSGCMHVMYINMKAELCSNTLDI